MSDIFGFFDLFARLVLASVIGGGGLFLAAYAMAKVIERGRDWS